MKEEIIKQLEDFVIVSLMFNNDFDSKKIKFDFYSYIQIIPVSINCFNLIIGSDSDFGSINLLKKYNFVEKTIDKKEMIKLINNYDFNFVQFEYSEDLYYQFYLKDDYFIEMTNQSQLTETNDS